MIIYDINGVKAQVIDGEIWVRAEIVQATILYIAEAAFKYNNRKATSDEMFPKIMKQITSCTLS
jgi:hypothetical protein